MADTVILDLALTPEGDLVIEGGDLAVVRDEEAVAQEVMFRLKTCQGDFPLEPSCGADLELLIGQPNSPETGALMEAQVSRALTHDGWLLGELRSVRAVPINRQALSAVVTVEYGDRAFSSVVSLDLREGILS